MRFVEFGFAAAVLVFVLAFILVSGWSVVMWIITRRERLRDDIVREEYRRQK